MIQGKGKGLLVAALKSRLRIDQQGPGPSLGAGPARRAAPGRVSRVPYEPVFCTLSTVQNERLPVREDIARSAGLLGANPT